MRSAQVYRWQIPMDAGVVLRDRRLKTRDGLYVCLREGEREGWGEISPLPGFSQETWEDAQSVLLAWVNNWLAGDCELPQMPSVAFGVSCALAELAETLPQAANYRAAPLCNGDPDDLILKLADMPGEKVAKVKVGLYEAVRDGMCISEFPTTMEAAETASQSGLCVTMGAPNIVRGKSSSGNVSAMDVAKAGCLGSLSSDYVPVSLLEAVFILAGEGVMPLHRAIALVTSTPASLIGLTDRGSLTKGLSADMVHVRMRDGRPLVCSVWRKGQRVF